MSDLKSAIYGLAIGDALGVPYEFRKRGNFKCTGMIGYGTHNQPEGTWSDDTSMTLATMKSIKEKGKIDVEDIRNKFIDWYKNGNYTADGEVFDVGITTSKALSIGRGLDDIYSNGNGSLMRVLPLAFFNVSDDDVWKVSSITHAHDISKRACKIYIEIARRLLNKELLKDILLDIELDEPFERIKNLDDLSIDEISSTGYVVATLEASLWCILKTDSYKEAVIKAVNLGYDTDTLGAVTGGLAGIIYGYDGIDIEWINILRNKKLIDSCLF